MPESLQLIHVSDIHFGSGEAHGPINPKTGLNIRFEDFVAALDKTVQYAIDIKADAFLFSGDAYKTANPEPIYQKMFATQLKRLSDSGIKTILLVGNHDQILRSTDSHSMSVFQSLSVPGVITIDKPILTTIETKRGTFQLIGLPHITRHQLMTMEQYSQSSAAEIDRVLVQQITAKLQDYYAQLDATLPTVVTAHMTVDQAVAGIEQELLVGYNLTYPENIFVNDKIDYVALGHVHKHQVIRRSKPAIVYAGSLERVDFGEEKEDKGFIHVQLARHNTRYGFQSIAPRPFVTCDLNLTQSIEPNKAILDALKQSFIPGCVLRIRYTVNQEQLSQIDEKSIKQATSAALSIRLQPIIEVNQNRARIPDLNEKIAAKPMAALETYLDTVAPDRKKDLLARARTIINELNQDCGDSSC